jgi:hypothetical protein
LLPLGGCFRNQVEKLAVVGLLVELPGIPGSRVRLATPRRKERPSLSGMQGQGRKIQRLWDGGGLYLEVPVGGSKLWLLGVDDGSVANALLSTA